jgi:uncharacterized protein YndB with AHSA1/START domain
MATVSVTRDQDVIVAEIFIAAPPQRVFEALTDPNQRRQWWGQKGLYTPTESQSDLRPGGKWSGSGVSADGSKFHVEGEYLEVDPPRRLTYTWKPSFAHPLNSVVHWELEPREVHGLHARGPQKVGTGTLLKLRHEGFAGNETALAGHKQGWQRVLGWLQVFIEEGATVETRPVFATPQAIA